MNLSRTFLLISALLLTLSGCEMSSGPRFGQGLPQTGRVLLYHEWPDGSVRRFHAWRADRPEGPFGRITLVPVAVQGGNGPVVVATDTAAPMNRDLYYYLTEVGADGKETKVSSIVRARATIPNLADTDGGPISGKPKLDRLPSRPKAPPTAIEKGS